MTKLTQILLVKKMQCCLTSLFLLASILPQAVLADSDVTTEATEQNTPTGWTAVSLPSIPAITSTNTFTITDAAYGASTSSSDNTAAIQAALDAVPSTGGMVVIPAGTYLCGPLTIKSKTVFHIAAGATLKLLPYGNGSEGKTATPTGFYPTNGTNSSGKFNYKMFLTCADNATDIIVEGEGTTSVIDGQGADWWPVTDYLGTRPPLIRFQKGSKFLFRNFKLQNAPGTNLTLGNSGNATDFTVHDITISNPSSEANQLAAGDIVSHNTDGMPIWGARCNIYDCDISTGDDNIVVDSNGQYIHAWNIICGYGHGMSIGSYTEKTHDIIYEGITFNNTSSGFKLKSTAGRSGNDQSGTSSNGAVKNIIFRNSTMSGVRGPLKITAWYDDDKEDPTTVSTPSTVTYQTPEFCNVLFQNIQQTTASTETSTSWKHSASNYIYGRPEMYVHDITFDNVQVVARQGMFLAYCNDNIKFQNGCKITNVTYGGNTINISYNATTTGSYDGTETAVTYDVNFMNGSETYTTEKICANSYAYPPTAPTKAGYTFKGWATTDGGEAVALAATQLVAGGTFYALWEKSGETIVTKTVYSLTPIKDKILSLAYQASSSLSDYATITGGTATIYNGKNNTTAQNMVSDGAVHLGGSSASYLTITLTDKTFAKGDVINIKSAGNWKISNTTSKSNAITVTAPYTITGDETETLVGKSTIYIWKTGTTGDPSDISSLSVTRQFVGSTRTVTASGENGTVEIKNGDATVASGSKVADGTTLTFTAVPNDGYSFTQWSDGNTANPRTITVDGSDISLTATFVQGAIYPLTATWDFETTGNYTAGQYNKQNNSTPFTVSSSSVTSGSAQNLTVDVTTGKFYTNTNKVQVNSGTKIRVPITSNSDVVTVKAYSGYQSYFTIGGVTMSAQTVEHTATNAEATQKYVEIVATGNGYLLSISVLQKNEQIVKGTKTVTYYDYDGITSLGTQTVTEGEAVGTFEKTCTPPTGYTFEGWYTADGSAFTTTSSVTEDMSVYPYIYKVVNGYYQIPANCGKVLLYTLNKAVADEKIYVPDGTYDFGTASATIKVNNVSIIGQSMSGTVIKNTPAAENLKVCLLHNTGTETYIQDVTLQSYAPWNATNKAERSSGLFDEGTKTICKNVYLKGTQDTYLSNNKAMYAYFDGGKIEGTVDFICGSGKVFFEGVNIYCANSSTYGGGTGRTTGDVVIAPQPLANDAKDTPVYGYVFNNCTLDGESTQNNNFTLGRGWGQDKTRTEYIYSLFAHTTKAINYKTKVEGNMNDSELTITEQDTPISDCKSYLDNEWTPNTIAGQVTTVPSTGIFLVNGSITTTKPASGTAMRVANSRGGFGPELIEGSKIENPTPSGGSTPDVTTTTATGSWTASGIADAVKETTTTQTTQIDLSGATLTNATSENKVTIPTANPNIIIKAKDAAQAATIANDNVVYNDGTENVCNSFVVKDGGNIKITEGFKATSAKYTRTVASGETLAGKLGTIYLPFPVKSDDNVKYYTFESLSGSTMNLTYVETLEANTPAVVKYVTDGTSISATNASVAVVGGSSSTDKAYKLVGTYEPITLTVTQDDARYYFAGTTGMFYSFTQAPNGVVNVPAFRAYFAPKDANEAKAMNLNINLIEGEVTGISNLDADFNANKNSVTYNLAGQKVNANAKGIVIKNGRKYFNK